MRVKEVQISGNLEKLGRRLRRFRETHVARTRLPEELWAAAVSAAKEEGLYRTSRVLHLDYAKLKRKIESSSKSGAGPAKRRGRAERRTVPASFVELVADSITGDCLIELERAGGERMRIRMKMNTPEVMNLMRYWCGGQV